VPAAAVIPAPIVYIKVAAVKKLVVGFRSCHHYCLGLGVSLRRHVWSLVVVLATVIIKVYHDLHGVYWMLTSYFLVT
jgi:hypothetical protein